MSQTKESDFTTCPFCHGDADAFIGGNAGCECGGTGLMELAPGVSARRLAIDVARRIDGITYAPVTKQAPFDSANKFPGITLPPCPECGSSVTMPTRMGMSVNNCKCCKCGKTFSAITSFDESHIARLKEIYADVNPDTILSNTNTRIILKGAA